VEIWTVEDDEYTMMLKNINVQITNGLFTFAAVLNLPVRTCRLWNLWKEGCQGPSANPGVFRKITLRMFPSAQPGFDSQTTEAWEKENELIFKRLKWSTRHIIIQALLWNSIFQIINQVFRCIYYSFELSDTYPGNLWVNVFFPLAILASVIAALTQAMAENNFRDEHHLGKKPNDLKKTLVEFWYNIWKDQTEGQVDLANKFENRPPDWRRTAIVFDLRRRTVAGRTWPTSSPDDELEENSGLEVGQTGPPSVKEDKVPSTFQEVGRVYLEMKDKQNKIPEDPSSQELEKDSNSGSLEVLATANLPSKDVQSTPKIPPYFRASL